jgi:WD40 repeat protein
VILADNEDQNHEYNVICVQFSPDSTILASGSYDETIRIHRYDPDADTFAFSQTLTDPTSEVKSLSFTPNGRFLAASSHKQNAVHLYKYSTDTSNFQHHITFRHVSEGNWAQTTKVDFSIDGRVLFVMTDDRTAMYTSPDDDDWSSAHKSYIIDTRVGKETQQRECSDISFGRPLPGPV